MNERISQHRANEAAVGLVLFGASAGLVFFAARKINAIRQGVNELHDLNKNLAGIRAQLEEISRRIPEGGVEDLIEGLGDVATVVGAFNGHEIIRPNRIEKIREHS